jgi:chromosomal replication initiation ATPase DnaA
MALSKNVKENLEEAQGCLRAALANAARSERPITIKHLSEILHAIDGTIVYDEHADRVEEMKNSSKNGGFNGWFLG